MSKRSKRAIRIEAYNRWDALDLTRNLSPWSWYLVSQGRERWDVCVRPGARGRRGTDRLLETVQDWANRREVDSVVHLDGADVPVHHGHAPHA